MNTIARVATGLVAVLHVWFFVLETLLWRSELARKSLAMTEVEAEATAVLAGNQGVYNLVLAVGLALALLSRDARAAKTLRRFLLGSIVIVGVYGAISARVTILFIQALPAAIALVLSLIARDEKSPAAALPE